MNSTPLIKLLTALTLVAAVFTLPSGGATHAAPAQRSTSGIVLFQSSTVVPDAWSSLVRNDGGVAMTIHTTGLPANSADTVWWVVFNQPQHCHYGAFGLRCGLGDLFNSPAAQPSVMYATGHVLGSDGVGAFGGHLRVDETGGCVAASIPPHFPCNAGLTNPLGADVHLVIRTHGDPIPGLVHEQISSFDGGCAINACRNVQASAHEATG